MIPLIMQKQRQFAACYALAITAAAISFFCVNAGAQTNAPGATAGPVAPVKVTVPPPTAATPASTQHYVFQTQSPLVVVDVVALDSSGNPVHDLKVSDFTVKEGGEAMTVKSFEEHRSDQSVATAAAVQAAKVKLGPNVFTNYAPMPDSGPLNVLLLDALNTQMENQMYVRQQMLKYVASLPAGRHVAIFALTDHLMLLQGFTSDPALLKAAIQKGKAFKQTGVLLPSQLEDRYDQNVMSITNELSVLYGDPGLSQQVANLQQFQAEVTTAQTTERVADTVAAMNALARYLSGMSGRKNLIWFSGSFPLSILPDTNQIDPFRADANFADDVKATADLLARSQVAVYPVDARGIFTDPNKSASYDSSSDLFTSNSGALNPVSNAVPRSFSASAGAERNQTFFQATDEEHSTMDMIADQTGGKAFYKTNNLKDAITQALDNGSNYYTITYVPADRNWDGSYRKVNVSVDRKKLQLYYRHGYYADDPQNSKRGEKVVPVTPMQVAMLSGGPTPMQIIFTAAVQPAASTEDTVLPSNKTSAIGMKPPYRRYTIRYADDVRNISMKLTPDGNRHATLELAAVVYNAEGRALNVDNGRVSLTLTPANYQLVQKEGLRLTQQIDAPVGSGYFLRIGMHDLIDDHVGAIEIPLAELKIPPSAPAAPATSTPATSTPATPAATHP